MPNILTYRKGFLRNISDQDAATFINAAVITDHNQRYLIDQHIYLLKYASVWNDIKAGYMIIGGTAASHKFNYKDPRDLDAAFRLTFTGGWTHASTGMTGNGTTGYANTFLVPSTSLALGSAAIGYYSRTNSSVDAIEIGATNGGADKRIHMLMRLAGGGGEYDMYDGVNARVATSGILSNRLHIMSRRSTTDYEVYRDGSSIGTNTSSTIGSIPTVSLFINASNSDGTEAILFSNRECAYAFVSNGLILSKVTAITNAVNILQTGLFRNV